MGCPIDFRKLFISGQFEGKKCSDRDCWILWQTELGSFCSRGSAAEVIGKSGPLLSSEWECAVIDFHFWFRESQVARGCFVAGNAAIVRKTGAAGRGVKGVNYGNDTPVPDSLRRPRFFTEMTPPSQIL